MSDLLIVLKHNEQTTSSTYFSDLVNGHLELDEIINCHHH